MARADPSPGTATDTASTEPDQWRLRYMVGELEHYTEWTAEFPHHRELLRPVSPR